MWIHNTNNFKGLFVAKKCCKCQLKGFSYKKNNQSDLVWQIQLIHILGKKFLPYITPIFNLKWVSIVFTNTNLSVRYVYCIIVMLSDFNIWMFWISNLLQERIRIVHLQITVGVLMFKITLIIQFIITILVS